MPLMDINIGGKIHQISCEPGEEEKLDHIVQYVNSKLAEVESAAPHIQEIKKLILALVMITDETIDLKEKFFNLSAAEQEPKPNFQDYAQQLDMLTHNIQELTKRLQ